MRNQAFSKIGILIIIIILVAGGVVTWQYLGIPKEEKETPEQRLSDETTDWKTYRNEEYGFEVKYPSDWFIADGKFEKPWSPGLNSFRLIFTSDEESLASVLYNGKLVPLTHGWHDLDIFIQERSFAEEGIDILRVKGDQCKVINFADIEASECLLIGRDELGNRLGPIIEFDYKDRRWIISWPTLSEEIPDYDPIYDQILSTFRFLE